MFRPSESRHGSCATFLALCNIALALAKAKNYIGKIQSLYCHPPLHLHAITFGPNVYSKMARICTARQRAYIFTYASPRLCCSFAHALMMRLYEKGARQVLHQEDDNFKNNIHSMEENIRLTSSRSIVQV